MDTWSKRIMLIVTGFFWFSMYTYVPTLGPYAKQLGASYDMVGLIIGSYGFTQLILRIPMGVISDAWGSRKTFVIGGILVAALSGMGMWLVPTVGALLLFRALAGAAASTWVDYTVLYASYFPGSEAPKAIGFINAVNNLGQVAAMLAGGYVAQSMGMEAPFILSAVFGGIGIILSLFVQDKRLKPKKVNTLVLQEALHDKNLLRLSALAVILQIVTYVTVFGFLPMAALVLGASSFELGLLTTITMVPSIFSSAMSGSFFRKHFGERATLVAGMFIMSATCAVIPFISSLELLYFSQALGGFGRGLVFPLLMGLSIKNFATDKRSTAMGVFQAIYGLGMFGGPVLAGVLSSNFGLAAGFLVTGIIGLTGTCLAGWRWYLPLTNENTSNTVN
ncbi:MFS transporter [Anaerospora sp.]|uniref:MFS transporter n=1 Tax=Anaerospora sp. TaxID=1960278 RepID=UPI00289A3CAD|nr:MFS transporter [Anaerospora sp.]